LKKEILIKSFIIIALVIASISVVAYQNPYNYPKAKSTLAKIIKDPNILNWDLSYYNKSVELVIEIDSSNNFKLADNLNKDIIKVINKYFPNCVFKIIYNYLIIDVLIKNNDKTIKVKVKNFYNKEVSNLILKEIGNCRMSQEEVIKNNGKYLRLRIFVNNSLSQKDKTRYNTLLISKLKEYKLF